MILFIHEQEILSIYTIVLMAKSHNLYDGLPLFSMQLGLCNGYFKSVVSFEAHFLFNFAFF